MFPVACTLGADCVIQQYLDRDPGPAAEDFTCGTLSYDGHKGTDFRVTDWARFRAGVDVLAAAPGVVTARRDGMADAVYGADGSPDVAGRECGNGVVIDHGNGWETQYCHLGRGSVRVARGVRVEAGDVLGEIGLSGQTQFPHLHLSVRRDGQPVDPFAPESATGCVSSAGPGLWDVALPYRGGGIMAVGFADEMPDFGAVRAGAAGLDRIGRDAPALVVWAFYFGPREGDEVRLRIDGPAGEVIDHRHAVDRTQAQAIRAAGLRRPPGGWPAGRYRARIEFWREGRVLDTAEAVISAD